MKSHPILLALLLAACGPREGFPSLAPRPGEQPRIIAAPGEGVAPALAPEQQQSLRADLVREGQALAAAQAEIGATAVALDQALAREGGARPGTPAWSDAQMLLSRLDLARAPLADIAARLVPLQLMVDSLDAGDTDRAEVEALVAATARAIESAQQRAEAATARLRG